MQEGQKTGLEIYIVILERYHLFSSLPDPLNFDRETRRLSNSTPFPPPAVTQLCAAVGCTVRPCAEEKYFDHPRTRLIRLRTFVVPGNERWTVAVNSTAGQLEYECTHIRDFGVHVKAMDEKRDTKRGTMMSKEKGMRKVKERSEETL